MPSWHPAASAGRRQFHRLNIAKMRLWRTSRMRSQAASNIMSTCSGRGGERAALRVSALPGGHGRRERWRSAVRPAISVARASLTRQAGGRESLARQRAGQASASRGSGRLGQRRCGVVGQSWRVGLAATNPEHWQARQGRCGWTEADSRSRRKGGREGSGEHGSRLGRRRSLARGGGLLSGRSGGVSAAKASRQHLPGGWLAAAAWRRA